MAANTNVDILLRVRDEASAKLKDVANEVGGLAGTFQRLTAGLGLWGAIATGVATAGAAIVATAGKTADLVEQLDRASKITGVGIEPLQAMFKIVSDAGGDTEALTTALGQFRVEIGKGNPLLETLGITTGSVEDRFIKLAEIISTTSNEEAGAAAAKELLGKGAMSLIPHLAELATKTKDVADAQRKNGEMITEKLAPSYRKLDEATDGLKSTWKGVWQDMANAMSGPATFIINRTDDLLKAFRGYANAVSEGLLGPLRDLAAVSGAGSEAPRYQSSVPTIGGIEIIQTKSSNPLNNGLPKPVKTARQSMEAEQAREAFRQQRQREEAAAQAEFWKSHFLSPLDGGVLRKPGGFGMAGAPQQKRENPFKQITDDWKKSVNEMLAGTELFRNGLQAVWDGMGAGFSQVFMGLTSKMQTFRTAWGAIWRAMRDAALQYLSEIVRSALFKLFLRLVGNFIAPGAGNAAGFVDDTPFARYGGGGGTTSFGGTSMATSAPVGSGGVTNYFIQTISSKDLVQSLASPTGAMRTANSRLYEVAAAS